MGTVLLAGAVLDAGFVIPVAFGQTSIIAMSTISNANKVNLLKLILTSNKIGVGVNISARAEFSHAAYKGDNNDL